MTISRRIAVVGQGRMGTAVVREAEQRGHRVVATVSGAANRGLEGLSSEGLGQPDVVIEFTSPASALGVVRRLIELDVPVVSGTTGWFDDPEAVGAMVAARRGALLHATNFSVGAHLMFRAARQLAQGIVGREEFDASIFERHHRRKVDAPSGTALTLQRHLAETDPARAFPIVSERVGANPGEHILTIDGPYETLTLTHAARDRSVFAAGAVLAAEWLPGRTGVYGFESVLFGDDQ